MLLTELLPVLESKKVNRTVDGATAYIYRGDLYGLLKKELSIPEEDITLTIQLNGYNSSSEYDGLNTALQIIPTEVLTPYK